MPVIQGDGAYVITGSQGRTWRNAGVPVNGTSGTFAGAANLGDLLADTTNDRLYQNTGTLASPTWTLINSADLSGASVSADASTSALAYTDGIQRVDIAAGATGDTVITSPPYKCRLINAWLVKRTAAGGGAGTIQVKNGAPGTAITDAMSINVAQNTVVRCATLDTTQWDIPASTSITVTRTRTASTDESCTVFLALLRVP